MSSTRCDCIGLLSSHVDHAEWRVLVRDPDCLVHGERVDMTPPAGVW